MLVLLRNHESACSREGGGGEEISFYDESSHTSCCFCFGHPLQKLWAVFCPPSECTKVFPSLGGCWDHLLILILGVSIPRLSPSRTKGMMYHLHFKCSVVGEHWDRRKPLQSSVEFGESPATLQLFSEALLPLRGCHLVQPWAINIFSFSA